MTCFQERVGTIADMYYDPPSEDKLSHGFVPSWAIGLKIRTRVSPVRAKVTYRNFCLTRLRVLCNENFKPINLVVTSLAGIINYDMRTCVCSRYNARSDWLILGDYSPVIPTGRLWTSKNHAKSHIINYLLTSNVQPLRKNLNLGRAVLTPVNTARSRSEISPY